MPAVLSTTRGGGSGDGAAHGMKHVQRRHFFVRDMVENFEIEVPFVRTADNLADFFTKPMKSATQFHTLRRMIMNERD